MQTCPICGQHSLEYIDGRKSCLRNGCPCYFKVDAEEVRWLKLLESIYAESLRKMSHSDPIMVLRNVTRKRLAAVLEGDPKWPEYDIYVKVAKEAGAFERPKVYA